MRRLTTLWHRFIRYSRAHPWQLSLRIIAIAALAFVMGVRRVFWTPDTLFIVLLALFVIFGQARAFLVRFLPFIVLLLVYDSFRGIADNLNKTVHFKEMIDFDKWITGGTLPTAWLQQHMWNGHVRWYDFYFYLLYTLHFVMPIGVAILLWLKRPKLYWPFVVGLLLLSFMAFITYVAFPAAPPWMASDMHYIQPIHRISSDIWGAMGVENFSEIYSKLSPNPVAAVPSLHAAYPLFFLLFLAKAFGWKRVWWLAIYPLSLWLGIVYLGEHYVFDFLLGALYAVVAYFATLKFFALKEAKGWTWRSFIPHLHRVTVGVHPDKKAKH